MAHDVKLIWHPYFTGTNKGYHALVISVILDTFITLDSVSCRVLVTYPIQTGLDIHICKAVSKFMCLVGRFLKIFKY